MLIPPSRIGIARHDPVKRLLLCITQQQIDIIQAGLRLILLHRQGREARRGVVFKIRALIDADDRIGARLARQQLLRLLRLVRQAGVRRLIALRLEAVVLPQPPAAGIAVAQLERQRVADEIVPASE